MKHVALAVNIGGTFHSGCPLGRYPADVAGISQQLEQETGSGDSDRLFTVSGVGDSSNQCVGISSAVNTGNVQTATGFIQYASNIEDFEQDNVNSEFTVDDNSSDVACEQQVNQASAG
jgi:hypothetical protein